MPLAYTFDTQEASKMDQGPKVGRSKKSDKAKRTYDLTGGLSQKHVRIAEALAERNTGKAKPKTEKKK